jgi:hypothetical protein
MGLAGRCAYRLGLSVAVGDFDDVNVRQEEVRVGTVEDDDSHGVTGFYAREESVEFADHDTVDQVQGRVAEGHAPQRV